MTVKMTETALRKKNRSLETMLSRARGEVRDALAIAKDAVKIVEELRNGKDQEAVDAFRRALERTETLARSLAGRIGEAGAEAGAEGAPVEAGAKA